MIKCKFLKTKCFTFYKCEKVGYIWFRLFNLKISFKHIFNYDFKDEEMKGFLISNWLITIMK
jgi:hypothetical protein